MMRGKSKSRFSSRASKRKNEAEFSNTSEPEPKRLAKKNDSRPKVDKYCWLCHTEANDKICKTCQRAYHNKCLNKDSLKFHDDSVCPECMSDSVDGTVLSPNKFFNLDKLNKMLDVLTRRSFAKKKERNAIFLRWPEEDRANLFKIVDFEILLDNINHILPYTKTAEFYADVRFIYHNSCIAYGANSEEAKAAEHLRRDFKTELLDLEACPECYYYLYCDENDHIDAFVRLCDSPHDIVWAQLTGHPYWPAKCLKVVKGVAHVRFFGEHEHSNIPISKCLFMSESHPKDKNSRLNSPTNSGPKSQRYKSAKAELLQYIYLYRRKYGSFQFYSHKKPYKPSERRHEAIVNSTEASCHRNLIQMKLEGNVNEDSEMFVINATEVVDSDNNLPFENNVTSDIPTPIGSGTEGQYPTYAELQPSIGPSTSTDQCQYETLASSVLPSSVAPSIPSQDNLSKSPSAVTSIDMTFSTDENNFDIENANPVDTSIDSLSPTVADVVSTASENESHHASAVHKFRKFIHNHSKGTETIQTTEILSEIVNSVSNDSTLHPDSLHHMVNNFPLFTGSQTEVDNEVHYIGQEKNVEADEAFNPDIILPVLMEENPELKTLVQKARYTVDAFIVHSWATFCKNPNIVGKISKLYVDLRKCKSELEKALEEIDKLHKENDTNKYTIQGLIDTRSKLENFVRELQSKLQLAEDKSTEAINNAKMIIRSLKSGCAKKIEEILRKQFIDTINEKDDCIVQKTQQLQEAKEKVNTLEEENRKMKEELEKLKVEKQRTDEKLEAVKSQISPDSISEYKRTHYCWVCELPAGVTCCLNTSYCSEKCQNKDAENHKKNCRRNEQTIIKQRVSEKTYLYMSKSRGVIAAERAGDNIFNSEISKCDPGASCSNFKRAHTRLSSSPLLPNPYDRGHSSSRSHSSKSKQRYR